MELAEGDSDGEEVCLVAGDLIVQSIPWAALATEQEEMQDDDEMIPTADTFEKVSAHSRVFAGLYRTALDAEMNTQVFVYRVARYVYWWDVSGRKINEPAIGGGGGWQAKAGGLLDQVAAELLCDSWRRAQSGGHAVNKATRRWGAEAGAGAKPGGGGGGKLVGQAAAGAPLYQPYTPWPVRSLFTVTS